MRKNFRPSTAFGREIEFIAIKIINAPKSGRKILLIFSIPLEIPRITIKMLIRQNKSCHIIGSVTDEEIERQIVLQIEQLKKTGDVENLFHGRWAHMEALDEDEWLEHLEEHLKEIVNISGKDEMTLAGKLEAHRKEVHDRIAKEHPELAERFKERRHLLDEHLKEHRPEVYELVLELREKRKE